MTGPIKTITATKKRFTIAFMCVDPPTPVWYANTNVEKVATDLFERMKESEIQDEDELGPGGEWTLVLWEHKGEREVIYMRTSDPMYSEDEYVYHINYPFSTILQQFSYMSVL